MGRIDWMLKPLMIIELYSCGGVMLDEFAEFGGYQAWRLPVVETTKRGTTTIGCNHGRIATLMSCCLNEFLS